MTETATEERTDAQPAAAEADATEVHDANLVEAEPTEARSAGGQIDILLDTAIEVSVRLGQVEMPARELIQLGPGSVLALDKQAGEPVDLLMRGIPFATGRLVIVGEQLGVRIEQILPPSRQAGPPDV